MTKLFKIFLVLVFALLLPVMAKADCAWFINANCEDVFTKKPDGTEVKCGLASNNSFCSGQAPSGFSTTKCCCCDPIASGCCEKIDKNTQAKTAMTSTIAACYANGNWANITWYEGQTAVSNTCLLIKNGKECRYIKGGSGNACANAGYGIDASLQTCKDFGLPDPSITDICCCREIKLDSGVKGCCQLLTTKVGETGVKTALNITSSECLGKNQTASGSSGTTVDAKFYANQLPDGTGTNCVTIPDKGDEAGTSPGQVGGEVNFNYTGMTNPLNTVNPSEVVGRVIKAVLAIIGSIFLIMVIYGGFIWMTAAGNDTKVTKGRNILVWSIAGVIVIFLSWILVAVIFEALAV